MTVAELIEKLKEFKPDMKVKCAIMDYQWDDDNTCEEYMSTVNMTEDCIRVYKNNLLLGELDERVYQR